jgi:hypothetical protein
VRAAAVVLIGGAVLAASTARAAIVCVAPPAVTACPNHTVQAGVDAAAAGDVVKIAAGVYFESVTIPSGKEKLQLIGAGKLKTIIDHDGANAGLPGISIQANDVSISNLTIQNGTDWGILAFGDRTKISGVRVVGVHSTTAGAIEVFGSGTQVVNSEVRGCARHGIALLGDKGIVRGNVVAQVTGMAIFIQGPGGEISANSVATVGSVPSFEGAIRTSGQRNVVASNVVENVGPSGSSPNSLVVSDNHPTVQGNRLTWAGYIDVTCVSCNGGKILLNTILGSPSVGLLVQVPSPTTEQQLVIQGNSVAATAATGIWAATLAGLPPGGGLRVTRNSVADTGFGTGTSHPDCFLATGSGHVFTANSARGCAGAGFRTVADNIELTGNLATGVGTNGFFIDGYNGGGPAHFGARLVGNKATSATGDGFALYDSNGGSDQPVGTTGTGNTGLFNRQDFCNEGAATTIGTFASTSVTCDIRR